MNPENPDPLPITEQENLKTTNLSSLPVREIIRLMNDEDALVAQAISLRPSRCGASCRGNRVTDSYRRQTLLHQGPARRGD